MDRQLGQKPDVRPVVIINPDNLFADDDDSDASTRDEQVNAAATKNEIEDDPFLTGTRHRHGTKGKKNAPVRSDPTEGLKVVMESLKEKWDDDKLIYEQTREEDKLVSEQVRKEEKEVQEKILAVIRGQQQTVKEAVDVLKIIAEKL